MNWFVRRVLFFHAGSKFTIHQILTVRQVETLKRGNPLGTGGLFALNN